jgi:hypothetical protein
MSTLFTNPLLRGGLGCVVPVHLRDNELVTGAIEGSAFNDSLTFFIPRIDGMPLDVLAVESCKEPKKTS